MNGLSHLLTVNTDAKVEITFLSASLPIGFKIERVGGLKELSSSQLLAILRCRSR